MDNHAVLVFSMFRMNGAGVRWTLQACVQPAAEAVKELRRIIMPRWLDWFKATLQEPPRNLAEEQPMVSSKLKFDDYSLCYSFIEAQRWRP